MAKKKNGKKGFFQKLKNKITKKDSAAPADEHEDLHVDEEGDTGDFSVEEMTLSDMDKENLEDESVVETSEEEDAPPPLEEEDDDDEQSTELEADLEDELDEEYEDEQEEEVGELQEMSVPKDVHEQTDEIPAIEDIPGHTPEISDGTQEINPNILAQLGVDETSKNDASGEHTWEGNADPTLKEMPLPETSPKSGWKDKAKNLFLKAKEKTQGASSKAIRKLSDNAKKGKYGDKLSEFSWNDFISNTFSTGMRPAIHRGFLVSLLAISSYSVGKIGSILLRGRPNIAKPSYSSSVPPTRSLGAKDIPVITRANLFNSSQDDKTKPTQDTRPKLAAGPSVCRKSDRKSSLPIQLKSTIVLQDSVKSLASVQVRGKKEIMNIREGEKVEQIAIIGKIDRLKLVFKNLRTGACEFVESDDLKKGGNHGLSIMSPSDGRKKMNGLKDDRIKINGNKLSIKKNLRDEMLEDIGSVLTQARAIQINNPDGSISFKITEIVPGSIYSKLNIEDNDIVTSINGKKMTNLNEIMSLFGQIKDIDNLSLSLLRNGSEREMEYSFE